jgi:hypothetical protein
MERITAATVVTTMAVIPTNFHREMLGSVATLTGVGVACAASAASVTVAVPEAISVKA